MRTKIKNLGSSFCYYQKESFTTQNSTTCNRWEKFEDIKGAINLMIDNAMAKRKKMTKGYSNNLTKKYTKLNTKQHKPH